MARGHYVVGMPKNKTVDVSAVIGDAGLGAVPLLVVLLSFLVITLDGYNYLCLSFIAPALAKQLQVPVASFAWIYTAGYFGTLVGGVVIGPISDRLGRKNVLLASVVVFGLCSLLPVFDLTYNHLLFYRFLTGLGLGGAMPSAIALTAEYAPRRHRGLMVNLMFAGIATGAVVGGVLASRLVPAYGWQSAFWLGALPPLLLVVLLALAMPESVTFLASKGLRPDYVARMLRRIDPAGGYSPEDDFMVGERVPRGAGRIADLLATGRALGTLLIWLTTFSALFAFGLVVSWLPTMMTGVGLPLRIGILGPVMLNLGGLVGSVILGALIDRVGSSIIIGIALALTALGLLIVGQTLDNVARVFSAIFVSGLFLVGAINSTNALMAMFYAVQIRGTGVGWALGMGRIGGIIGPLLGGLLIGREVAPHSIFLISALVAALGAAAIVGFGAAYPEFRRSPAPGRADGNSTSRAAE